MAFFAGYLSCSKLAEALAIFAARDLPDLLSMTSTLNSVSTKIPVHAACQLSWLSECRVGDGIDPDHLDGFFQLRDKIELVAGFGDILTGEEERSVVVLTQFSDSLGDFGRGEFGLRVPIFDFAVERLGCF